MSNTVSPSRTQKIAIVVAISENNGIGKDNQLLWHLPADLKHFKEITTGHAIIMGRKTFDSIGRPLPNRLNLVVSKSVQNIDGCVVFESIEAAIQFAQEQNQTNLFIIGGDSIYKQALHLCHKLYLTRIQHSFEADSFFGPTQPKEWQ
jgi:dihydrofolate reductase